MAYKYQCCSMNKVIKFRPDSMAFLLDIFDNHASSATHSTIEDDALLITKLLASRYAPRACASLGAPLSLPGALDFTEVNKQSSKDPRHDGFSVISSGPDSCMEVLQELNNRMENGLTDMSNTLEATRKRKFNSRAWSSCDKENNWNPSWPAMPAWERKDEISENLMETKSTGVASDEETSDTKSKCDNGENRALLCRKNGVRCKKGKRYRRKTSSTESEDESVNKTKETICVQRNTGKSELLNHLKCCSSNL
eukprot:m.148751 g.148751  ORF g.148751 m.148751 type:complete len:253 (-) comp15005_c0_seq5:487-1245(-)